MGRLDPFDDITGELSPLEVNAQNISNIIDELNRNVDQSDAIVNSLNIIGRGSLTMSWPGTTGFVNTVSQNHGFQTAPIFIASFTRDDNPAVNYQTPMFFYDTSGNFQQRVYAYTDATNINFQFLSVISAAPVNFKFSWYIIQQPASVPTGS